MSAAYFIVQDSSQQELIFELTDAAKIQKARDIISGKETYETHVMGRIVKKQVSYNPNWSYHIDPNSVQFFAMAIEVCDATIPYVEDHLDEACGAFLPGCYWCPWTSKIIREVSPS